MSLGHCILAVLSTRRATGYELNRVFDPEMAFFWSATHQQIYRELKELFDAGLVSCQTVEQQGRPDKKIYAITPAGREELRRWSAMPLESGPVRDTLLTRLLAGHVIDLDALRLSLAEECGRLRRRVDELESAGLRQFPDEDQLPLVRRLQGLALQGVLAQDRARLAFCTEVLDALARAGELAPAEPAASLSSGSQIP